jgi:hypothetical protein
MDYESYSVFMRQVLLSPNSPPTMNEHLNKPHVVADYNNHFVRLECNKCVHPALLINAGARDLETIGNNEGAQIFSFLFVIAGYMDCNDVFIILRR